MAETLTVSRAGVLTIETKTPHGFRLGDTAVITVAGKNDRWLVTAVHSDRKFSAIQDKRTRKQRRAHAATMRNR